MLYTDEEIAVMATAIQPNMRKAGISRKPYELIIAEQLDNVSFRSARVLDIGPGHWDFLDIARERGAATTTGIDFDPAVCKLGEMRGHRAILANLARGWPLEGEVFDAIFCRGSFNAFWYSTPAEMRGFLEAMMASLAPNGWLWIAPFNRPAASAAPEACAAIRAELENWLEARGLEARAPSETEKKYYGIGYGVPKNEIWRRRPLGAPGPMRRLREFLFRRRAAEKAAP